MQINGAATGNTIGGIGAGQGNTIAFNTSDGVQITGATTTGNAVRANSIFANGGKGINLAGTGNNNQAFPTLFAAAQGSSTEITGTFIGTANTTYYLDFFNDATSPDPSGFGEGKRYLGTAIATVDSLGDLVQFDFTLPNASTAGETISATITDSAGNTSQFAKDIKVNTPPTVAINNVPATGLAGTAINLTTTVSDPDTGDTFTYAWSVNKNGSSFVLPASVLTNQPSFSFTPDQAGTFQVFLTVTDSVVVGGTDNVNTAPIQVGALGPNLKITDSLGNCASNERHGRHRDQSGEPGHRARFGNAGHVHLERHEGRQPLFHGNPDECGHV